MRYKDPFNPRELIPVDIDLPASGKSYDARSNLSCVLTQLSRYSKLKSVNLDKSWYCIMGAINKNFCSRFLKRKPTVVSNEQFALYVNPVIEKMAKCGGIFKELHVALNDKNETFTIRFFLKTIQKVVLSKTLDADKCGQGISAWSKTINALYCPIFRAISQNLRSDLKDNVIYENGISENEYDYRVASLWQHDNEIMVNDFKEYDSKQDASTQFLEDCTYSMYLPPEFLSLFRAFRLRGKQKSAFVTLNRLAVKDSGAPDTLDSNTILNMHHRALSTRVIDVAIEAYKGDDSVINARKIIICNKLAEFDPTLHLPMQSDMDFPLHGDMGGWYYSQFGLIPDIFKIIAKFVCKDFAAKSAALEIWEAKRLNVSHLPYCEQIQAALRDREKFLNERKLMYYARILHDVYGFQAREYNIVMETFYYLMSDRFKPDDLRIFSSLYYSDSGYDRDDLTEADKNRKRVIQTYKNVENVML